MASVVFIVDCLIQVLSWLIVFYCILSWFPNLRCTKIAKFVDNIVDPILDPIRKIIDGAAVFNNLPVDFSPVIAIILLEIISSLI